MDECLPARGHQCVSAVERQRRARIAAVIAIPVAAGVAIGAAARGDTAGRSTWRTRRSGGTTTGHSRRPPHRYRHRARRAQPPPRARAPARARPPRGPRREREPHHDHDHGYHGGARQLVRRRRARYLPARRRRDGPVDGTGAAINTSQTAAQAATSMNCSLSVPANPLSAAGLATPWQLGDGCSMANAGTEGAFVEATILAPSGQLSGLQPARRHRGHPARRGARGADHRGRLGGGDQRRLQRHQPVPHWSRHRRGQLRRRPRPVGHRPGVCLQRGGLLPGRERHIANGTLTVPAAGTATDGQACETTRDFALIDQDQSDNVVSQYLITAGGQTAQNSPANDATAHRAPPSSPTAATTRWSASSSTRRTAARRSPRPTPPTRRPTARRRR